MASPGLFCHSTPISGQASKKKAYSRGIRVRLNEKSTGVTKQERDPSIRNDSASNVRVAIIGATGYTGVELARILRHHPRVLLAAATSEHHHGKKLSEVHPSLGPWADIPLQPFDAERIVEAAGVAFVALPARTTFSIVPELLKGGMKVIDLGPDFRFRDAEIYRKYYGTHEAPQTLAKTVYGLTEIHRAEVAEARLVGNPGCYPTAVVLGLAPLLQGGLVSGTVVVDAKSGVSGAGRGGGIELSFCEVNESIKPYAVGKHRHLPEMEEEFQQLAASRIDIVFVPHLVPMNRGILATSYVNLARSIDSESMASLYSEFYDREPFITVRKPGEFPETRDVRGSNLCAIGIHVDASHRRAIVVSAIDNLVKGAAGQAVQNMNRMEGFPEPEGLQSSALFP
jgi:N-acetyl-gamma-glutamyl-phosphate reductase